MCGWGFEMKRKQYDKELKRLQAKLCKLQEWVKYKGLRCAGKTGKE